MSSFLSPLPESLLKYYISQWINTLMMAEFLEPNHFPTAPPKNTACSKDSATFVILWETRQTQTKP